MDCDSLRLLGHYYLTTQIFLSIQILTLYEIIVTQLFGNLLKPDFV